MSIRLFLDEDVHAQLSTISCARGFDAIHAQEAGRNVKDFVLLHNIYLMQGLEHSGIVVSKQRPLAITLRKLLRFLRAHTRSTMT
ncbi:MAG: hypothetical protein AAB393_00365, partial [Bacteroidota bacterium]